jgi:hypothetical protein
MNEEEQEVDEVCQLIEDNWHWLDQEQQEAIELASNSMKFFLKVEEFDRFTYEYNIIKKIIKQLEF